MQPHLTLFGGRDPNPATNDPVVAAAVRFAAQSNPTAGASGPVYTGVGQDAQVVRILATAQGPGDAQAGLKAIVRVSPSLPHGYTILTWRTGAS